MLDNSITLLNPFPPQEIQQYLNGGGMGCAKIAELNGYPGPKHVLELENELQLTEQQKKKPLHLCKKCIKKQNPLGKRL